MYVFKNGVKGNGPFEFQPDVFDNPPGTKGYSPLRTISLVTWKNEAAARELRSAAEVKKATDAGELVLEQPGVVVNMPLPGKARFIWPGCMGKGSETSWASTFGPEDTLSRR